MASRSASVTPTWAAVEGTAAAEMAAAMVDKYLRTPKPLKNDPEFVNAPDEMFEAADEYARDILAISRLSKIAGGDYYRGAGGDYYGDYGDYMGVERALPILRKPVVV